MSQPNRTIPGHSPVRAMVITVLLSVVMQRSAWAQESTTLPQDSTTLTDSAFLTHDATAAPRNGWIAGPLVGVPGAGTEAYYPLAILGYGATRLVPNRVGLDFAIGTAPYALAFGVIPVAVRIGPSIPLPMGRDAFFIPSGGVSAFGAASAGGGGGVVGWYAGAAAVVAYKSVGLRAGATMHVIDGAMTPLWLAEIGMVHVPLPRRAH